MGPVIHFLMSLFCIGQDKELAEQLKILSTADKEKQEKALEKIEGLRITPEIGVRLIRASVETYPNEADYWLMINSKLLRILWHEGHADFLPAIEEVYDKLESKKEGRDSALRILTEMQTPESLALLAKLLKRPSSRRAELTWVFVPLKPSEKLAKRLFPEILECTSNLDNASYIYLLASEFAEKGFFDPNSAPEFAKHCVQRADELVQKRLKDLEAHVRILDRIDPVPDEKDKRPPDLFWEEFQQLEVLADVLGFLTHPEADDVLRRMTQSASLRLQSFAVASLLQRKKKVDLSLMEKLAQNPVGRSVLWMALESSKQLDHFPEKFRNQDALAEAKMVEWLQFPTELGCAPDEIQILAVVRFEEKKEGRRLYYFKYRRDDMDQGQWLVGVAGPYPEKGPPAYWGSKTFSRFKKLDEKNLDQHIRDYLDEKVPYTIVQK